MKDKKLNEKGAVAAIVVLAITAILGFGAVVIDGGLLYYQKARLETAVDAAALAGASVLRQGSSLARQAALDTAAANGLTDGDIEVDVDLPSGTVTARARRQVELGLARVLRISSAEVAAESAAGAFLPTGIHGAVPLGVVWQDFVFGQLYDLKLGDGVTGNYGALALGGTGAANYRDNLEHGYLAWLRTGELILTETGNMSNPTKTAVDARIRDCNHQPPCTHEQFVPSCTRVVTVPIISSLPNGRGEVSILGFAGFFLEGVGGQGNDNYVQGRFVRMFTQGEVGVANDYGLQVVKLLR